MTVKIQTFIGREKETNLIYKLLRESLPQALFLIGPGGVGKTMLLQHTLQIYYSDPSVVVFPIVDFDETSYRTETGIFDLIAEARPNEFDAYICQRKDFLKMIDAGISQSKILEEDKRTKSIFFDCYNAYVQNRRGVLLFDTIEIMTGSSLWMPIINSFTELKDTVFILAGRSYGQAKRAFDIVLGSLNVQEINLDPFSEEETLVYFSHLASILDPEISKKLYILTEGSPILLALAVEWLERDKPFPEIYQYPVEQFLELDQESKNSITRKFQEALVNQFLEPREILDNLIIRMAFIHRRFDDEILSYLNKVSTDKSKDLITKLRSFPFIKIRPYGISLHDEMRSLVNNYIWPKLDPMGLERRQLATKMVEYYQAAIERLHQTGDKIFWLYQVEELYYLLKYDLNEGLVKFKGYVEIASLAYRWDEIDLLLNEMEAVKNQYSHAQCYEIEIQEARNLLERGYLEGTSEKLSIMLQKYDADEQKIEILILLGNVDARLGNTILAIQVVEKALVIAQRIGSHSWMGKAELSIGWFYRVRGDWTKAYEYYEKSLDHTILSGDKITLGLIFNNLAYITEFSGDHISALGYAEQAIRFFEDLGANRQLAMCYSTMGKIYVYVGNYQKGLEYYQQSFDMFQKQNDLEFLGLVYSQISRALLELGQLDEARKNGEKGVELCQSYSLQNLPQALHRLGRVYERMGYLDLAIDCYKRGQKVSEEQLNSRYLMEHTTYLSHVYYKLWCLSDNPTKKEEYIKLIQSSIGIFDREASKGAYTYPMDYLLGRIKILLGNIQYDLKNYAAAIQIYKLAYYHIIIGSSETYTVDELNKFSDRLEKLPGQVALNWVQELESYWKEMNILESKPQALNFCKKQKISAMLASYVSKPKDK